MPLTMLQSPNSGYRPSWSGSVLRYRHPWVSNDTRNGMVRNVSLAKLTPSDRGKVEEQLTQLLTLCPTELGQVPFTLYPSLSESYFGIFSKVETGITVQIEKPTIDHLIRINLDPFSPQVEQAARVLQLEQQLTQALSTVKAQATKIESMTHLVGQQELRMNKHCVASLAEALEVFRLAHNPTNHYRKRTATLTVSQLLERLGNLPIRNITASQVDVFLDTFQDLTTIQGKRANLSIFFKTCQRKLNLSQHPFNSELLKKRSGKHNRIIESIKSMEELTDIIHSYRHTPDWQAFVATAILAGPRLSEQLGMKAEDFNLLSKPKTVTIYSRKTINNCIPIERKALLPIIQRFLAGKKGLLWTNSKGKRHTMKFFQCNFRRARAQAILQDKFSEVEKSIMEKVSRLPKAKRVVSRSVSFGMVQSQEKPYLNYGPRQFRHCFGTLLSLCGYEDGRIARMMRNSSAMVSQHYNAVSPLDKSLKGKLIWD